MQGWRSSEIRERLRSEFDYRCGYCGVAETTLWQGGDINGTGLMAVDHFVPRHRDPCLEDSLANLVYCCRFCNVAKGHWWTEDPEKTVLHRKMEEYKDHLQLQDDGRLRSASERGATSIEVMDLNDPRKVSRRRLEIQAIRERQELVVHISSFLGQISFFPVKKRAEAIASLRKMLEPLRGTFRDLPEPIDIDNLGADLLEKPDEPRYQLFDALEAERELTPYLISHLKQVPDDLRRLDPYVFEQLVAEFFASWGYEIKLLGRNPQTGADIMALKRESPPGIEIRYLIEVKRERRKIGIEEIHRILGVMSLEKETQGWDIAVVVSLSGFKDFRKIAPGKLRRHSLELKDGTDIRNYLQSYMLRTDGGLWLAHGWDIVSEPGREGLTPPIERTANGAAANRHKWR